MTEWTPSEAEQQDIFEETIAPAVFRHAPAVDGPPTFVVVDGQSGAGVPAAATRIVADYPLGIATVSSDLLQAFHPHFLELSRSASPEASRLLAEPVTGWVSNALRYGRTTGRSLLLEGSFSNPAAVTGAVDLFTQNGFSTRIVIVASPRRESLLASASRYLLGARAGRASAFTSVEGHDAAWEATRTLAAAIEAAANVDRLTVVGRDGGVRFDADGTTTESFAGATTALARGQSEVMRAPVAMRWLSELRAMTDYAMSDYSAAIRRVPQPVAEVLIELHEIALREVLPRLPLPPDSQARPAAEATLTRQLADLRGTIPVERPLVVPAPPVVLPPVVTPPAPGRGFSR